MKTSFVNDQAPQRMRRYVMLYFIIVSSFAWMGGCEENEDMKEIPADAVSTDVQQAPSVPVWVPAYTSPSIRFYFIPEMSIYYDAFLGDFVYWNGLYWVYSPVLPHGYIYFDLFDANIVFLSVGISSPWHNHYYYVSHYPVYFFAGRESQGRKQGWRFYNENGRKFMGPHNNLKYQGEHQNQQNNNFNSVKKHNDKELYDIPKQEKKQQIPENKSRKEQPGHKQQLQQNYQKEKGGGSKGKQQINTRTRQQESKGGGKKGS